MYGSKKEWVTITELRVTGRICDENDQHYNIQPQVRSQESGVKRGISFVHEPVGELCSSLPKPFVSIL